MRNLKIFVVLAAMAIAAGFGFKAEACTAVVVSGKHNASGRALMIKVRDSDSVTDMQYFKGPKYNFFGQTANLDTPHEKIKGVVSGSNTAGLCVASLTPGKGFPLDTLKKKMSGGKLNFRVLGSCANLAEFEACVNDLLKSQYIVAHIAALDAEGHAAMYEIIGDRFVKYDSDDPTVAPEGFRVMTNFTFAGDSALGNGQIRYDSTVEVMKSLPRTADGKFDLDPVSLMDAVTRTFNHTGNKVRSLADLDGKQYFKGKDFVTRNRTNTIVTFESALPGEDASKVAMWVNIASPLTTPAIPLIVNSGFIPEYLTGAPQTPATLVAASMFVRDKYVYDSDKEKRFDWFNVANTATMIEKTRLVEKYITTQFNPALALWREGKVADEIFYELLRKQAPEFYDKYAAIFSENN